MNKNAILKYLNPLLGTLFLLQAGSGLILKLAPTKIAGEIHELIGPLFVIVVILHFILNYAWVKSTYLKGRKK
ncbi:MAG: DUF4405 domain-containing protein [Desulfobacterales bacterium]|nr:DUF4405 domain-containing protein [Desulfobacterales bacterium]